MTSFHKTLACALVLAAAAASPALAAPKKGLPAAKPLVITDKAGDANGLNSQSHLAPADPSQSGGGERSAADLLSVSLGRLDNGKAVTGLKVTFTLAAAPDQGTIYRLQAATPDCSTFWIAYAVPIGGTANASLRENCSGTAVSTPVSATVKGSTITVTVPFALMPKSVKAGTTLSDVFGETKGHAATPATSPTVPTIDETAISPAVYKIGS